MNIARNLEYLLEKHQMSNYKLKQLLGCSASSIANWIKGTEPHPNMQEKIAAVFYITIDELNGEEFPPIRDLTEDPEKEKSPATNEGDKAISSDDLRHLAAFHAADAATKEAIRLLLKKFEQEESQ